MVETKDTFSDIEVLLDFGDGPIFYMSCPLFFRGRHPCYLTPSTLRPIDELLYVFSSQVRTSPEEALVEHNLAPLSMHRDLAMLALLHKVSLEVAPKTIANLFSLHAGALDLLGFPLDFEIPRHCRQLHDPVAFYHPLIILRSILGLVKVYNRLPFNALDARTPKSFQRRLQNVAKDAAKVNAANWQIMFHAS